MGQFLQRIERMTPPSPQTLLLLLGKLWPGRTVRRTLLCLGLAWLLLMAWGYFMAPSLVRTALTGSMAKSLQREVMVERVTIHPLSLELEVHGLSVRNREGIEQLGFERLSVNFSSLSLLRGALLVDELTLWAPRASVSRLAPGQYDVSDWLDRWQASPAPNPAPLPRFSIRRLRIKGGTLELDDRFKGVHHRLQALELTLPFLSSLPGQSAVFVEPVFSAVLDGSPLTLRARSQPFAPSRTSRLEIDLQSLDLGLLSPYWPGSLPWQLRGGKLSSRLSLDWVQPGDGPPALDISGQVQVLGLALSGATRAMQLDLDTLELTLQNMRPLQPELTLQALSLQGLRIAQDLPQAPLHLDRLRVVQARMDRAKRWLQAEQVEFSGLQAHAIRTVQDGLVWLAWPGLPTDRTASDPRASDAAATSGQADPPWRGRVAQLQLDDLTLKFEDRTVSPVAIQTFSQVQWQSGPLDLGPGQANAFALSGHVNTTGRLQAKGTLQWQPLDARLTLDATGLPLPPLQGYLVPYLNAQIVQGQVSAQGELHLYEHKDQLQASYQGRLALAQVRALDKVKRTDLLKWQSLALDGMQVQTEPARLDIAEVSLSGLDARLTLSPEGRLDLAGLLTSAPHAPPGSDAAAQADNSPAWPITVQRIRLHNGRVDFSDRFIKPNYTATVSQMGGELLNLSSAPDSLATLALRGRYGGTAPVEISARLNPLAHKKFLDLQARVSSIDLVDFSPYSGKYAGYSIDKGKLSLNARYTLKDRQLSADNQLFIDQLTFGEKVQSPDATDLPVHLAIALLRNNRGEIDIHLPIQGTVDDPQFSIRGLIFRAMGQLVVKTVTSPFAFLGSLFDGRQELSRIDFAAGSADLDDVALARLQSLARALRERASLTLDIAAGADTAIDTEGLRRVPSPQDPQATQDPQAVGEQALRALAAQRAQAVQSWLVEQGQIPLSRLFLLPLKLGSAPADAPGSSHNRVDFSLR